MKPRTIFSIFIGLAIIAAIAFAARSGAIPMIGGKSAAEALQDPCKIVASREFSGEFLRRTAHCLYVANAETNANPVNIRRMALVEDLYIKSWSYAVLNKAFFWFSVVLAIAVLIWPALGAVFNPTLKSDGSYDRPLNRFQRAIIAPAVQTSITALAAFSFAFYAHYKEKQTVSENLMRQVIYTEALAPEDISSVVAQLLEMDRGFGFSGGPSDITED